MAILIDGYNLLHATGIVGRGIGPGGLERSRLALVNFLAESIDPAELPHTTIVFDARQTTGLPQVIEHRGVRVRFAVQHDAADDLIEELIRADSAPRRLVVVSSDHRLQRAARRRRAKAIDSDVWYAELVLARRERHEASPGAAPSGCPAVGRRRQLLASAVRRRVALGGTGRSGIGGRASRGRYAHSKRSASGDFRQTGRHRCRPDRKSLPSRLRRGPVGGCVGKTVPSSSADRRLFGRGNSLSLSRELLLDHRDELLRRGGLDDAATECTGAALPLAIATSVASH